MNEWTTRTWLFIRIAELDCIEQYTDSDNEHHFKIDSGKLKALHLYYGEHYGKIFPPWNSDSRSYRRLVV